MNKKWEKPTNVGTWRACAPNAADAASGAQRPDCAPKGSTTLNVSTTLKEEHKAGHNDCGSTTCAPECVTTLRQGKKSKKMLRLFTAGSLAFFMGIGTLCGVLIAPMNATKAGILGETNSLQSDESNSALNLNLNPETDETIYTTENGIEIKSYNLNGSGEYGSLQYFTLGSYEGQPVNWIILAFNGTNFLTDSTDAGVAIESASAKGKIMAQPTASLAKNQLLCISQYAFNQTTMTINATAHAQLTIYGHQMSQGGKTQLPSGSYLLTAVYNACKDVNAFCSATPTISLTNANIVSNCLSLGTTFGINGLYGSKIVKNTAFNSDYIFSLNQSQYTSFVGSTGTKTPYLFNSPSTATNLFVPTSASVSHPVNTYFTVAYSYNYVSTHHVRTTAKASSTVPIINSSGVSATHTLASYTGTPSDLGDYYCDGPRKQYCNDYYHTKITYQVASKPNLTAAYRPAFVFQI